MKISPMCVETELIRSSLEAYVVVLGPDGLVYITQKSASLKYDSGYMSHIKVILLQDLSRWGNPMIGKYCVDSLLRLSFVLSRFSVFSTQ